MWDVRTTIEKIPNIWFPNPLKNAKRRRTNAVKAHASYTQTNIQIHTKLNESFLSLWNFNLQHQQKHRICVIYRLHGITYEELCAHYLPICQIHTCVMITSVLVPLSSNQTLERFIIHKSALYYWILSIE